MLAAGAPSTLRLRSILVVSLAGLFLLGLSPTPAEAQTQAEIDLACSINAERARQGLPGLRVAGDLESIAREHSQRMASSGILHHNANLGSQVQGWRLIAENVARGQSTTSIHSALMASSGHRANILNARVTELGVGAVTRNGQLWVTQVFRQPSGSGQGSLPSCPSSDPSGSEGDLPRDAIPVAGDWNGDGRTTPGAFKDGTWFLSDDMSGELSRTVGYGRPGDIPVVGDWTGSGHDSIGIVRGSEWHLRNTISPGRAHHVFRYGRVHDGDLPIVGDWDGNGRDTIGIIRDGQWHLRTRLSGGAGQIVFTYGRILRGDLPLIGDWNGDGRDTIGIVRQGEWHLRHSLSGGPGETVFTYGRVLRGDRPIIGDWNANGRSGVGIVRGSEWHLRNTLSGGSAQLVVSYQ